MNKKKLSNMQAKVDKLMEAIVGDEDCTEVVAPVVTFTADDGREMQLQLRVTADDFDFIGGE